MENTGLNKLKFDITLGDGILPHKVKNGGEYTISFLFGTFLQHRMKGEINKMKKILGIILSVVLILSSFSVLAVSATEPIAPTLPDNAIAVIDANGVSKTLGDNGDWAPQWWEGRFTKTGLSADVSDADFIEFDIKFSDYEAFKTFFEENSINFSINFSSTDDIWARSAAVINYFGTPIGSGWYHYVVPMSSFVSWGAPIDWSNIKTWHLYSPASDGSQKPFGELCSDTLTIINICATKSDPPASPENAVAVLDTEGYSGKVGDHAGNTMTDMYGRFNKIQQTTADFSNADYIEFDIYYSDYESFIEFYETNAISFDLNLTSNAGFWDERQSSGSIFGYGEAIGNGWYHYAIPKSAFINRGETPIDWSAIDTWYLIGEGPEVEVGEVYADIVAISNICGTTVPEPSMPEEAVKVLDAEGVSNTLGDNGSWAAQWWEGRFTKRNLSVDLTGADYIEFDIYYSDYDAFVSYLDTNNIDLSINITSSANTENPSWEARSAASIRDYEYDMGYGWYHYIVPKSAFVAWDTTSTDWSNVTTWHLYSANPSAAGTQYPFGDIYSDTLTIKNICGTVREDIPVIDSNLPDIPLNSTAVADQNGGSTTVGDELVWLWDRLYSTAPTADLSSADYIEFDLKSDMYDTLKGVDATNYLTFALVSDFATTQNKWAQRHYVFNVTNYETSVNGDWHHIRIPKTAFNTEEGADWSNKDFWMFGFWGGGAAGELAPASIEVKNICGTTYSFDKTGYTMVDEYAVIGTDKQVSDIVTDLTKVYDVNGIAVDSGKIVTGMSVRCEFDGWVYDQATFVIDNDIDGDGAVTASDMVYAKKFYFGASAATEIQNVAFTGSKTAEASIIDYIQMQNQILEG